MGREKKLSNLIKGRPETRASVLKAGLGQLVASRMGAALPLPAFVSLRRGKREGPGSMLRIEPLARFTPCG